MIENKKRYIESLVLYWKYRECVWIVALDLRYDVELDSIFSILVKFAIFQCCNAICFYIPVYTSELL